MAADNPGWGYTRIRGALFNIGHDIGRNTIKRILADAGLEPAPERSRKTTWKSFLKAHWGAVAATDFFTVEILTMLGLVRYFILFVIDLRTRRVWIAGIDPSRPKRGWCRLPGISRMPPTASFAMRGT
jgi:putative transposase